MIDRKELVEKMLDAAAKNGALVSGELAVATMDAALSVAIEELLKEAGSEEITAIKDHDGWTDHLFARILGDRRRKYAA
jgi:hypothetical protein